MGKKFDWWTIGGMAITIGAALVTTVFGAFRGAHDKEVAEEKNREELKKLVDAHFAETNS